MIGAGVGNFGERDAVPAILHSQAKKCASSGNSRLMPYYFKVFDYMEDKDIDPKKEFDAVKEKAKGTATQQWHTVE